MKNTKLWIADPDLAYVQAFAEYVNLKKGYLFQVCACTDQTRMEQTPDGDETEILLITAKWYEAWKDVLQGKCVILLSEGNLPGKFTSYPTVYKYQSVETILREIMYYYSEQDNRELYPAGVRKDNRVIGVYSPADANAKTQFALTLGQIVGETQHVLYLNMEECSGLTGLLGEHHWNMADLIYFLRQNKSQFLYRLNSMVQKFGAMDYIPPCDSYTDFCQITVKEWKKLLHLIRSQSAYDVIILDMGTSTGHELELLRQCDGIYMPVKKDPISRGKIEQWDRYIQIDDGGIQVGILREFQHDQREVLLRDGLDILELLQKLELPPDGTGSDSESDLSMLPEQRLGSYIRELLTS